MSKIYRTVQGDMWDSIAKSCYGSELGMNALMEANYRLNEKARYIDADTGNGIRRPVVGFGVQKIGASKRHVYTLSFTNGGGTTMSQRSMTRGLQGQDDTLRGLTVGFNLTRRIF